MEGQRLRNRCIDIHTLEALLRVQVDLLRLCDLLQDVLDDRSVPITDIAGR